MTARMTTLLQTVATNLRLRRNHLGLSQDAVADRAHLHRTFIGAVEREEKNLTIRSLGRLADALEIEAWRLLAPRMGREHD